MKYGIIGTGWIAESFIAGARLLCNAEIAAVYSRTREKGEDFAKRNNIPAVFTSLDEFSEGNFEAVYIASPNALHYSQSMRMIKAGKNVICEKPVTVLPEEFEACLAQAEKNGVVYIEAIMYMHTPNREKLKAAVEKIGNINSVHFDFSQLSSKYPAYLRGETPNIFNPALATGCLMDLGVYCVYPAVDIFGEPKKLTADSVFMRTGADSSGAALLNYGDKLVTLTYSKTGQDYSGSCIYGDKGTIEIESISKLVNITLTDNDGKKSIVCPDMPKEEIMGYEALEFESFVRGENRDKYALCSKRSLQVSCLMKQIRDISEIKFTEVPQ